MTTRTNVRRKKKKMATRTRRPFNVFPALALAFLAVVFFGLVLPNISFGANAQEPESAPFNPPVIVNEATVTMTDVPTESPTPTPVSPTVIPSPTRIPCPPEGQPAMYGEISVVYHEHVGVDVCNLIQKYVSLANDRILGMGYQTGPIEVAVFSSVDAVTDYVYDTALYAGCNPDSKDIIRADWIRGGAMSTKGAMFLLNGKWGQKYDLASAIAHEITQVTAQNYLGSCQVGWTVPAWFSTGLAEYHAEIWTLDWGLTPWEEDLWRCNWSLPSLEHDGSDCLYMEAQMAFHLLQEKYGADRGLQVMIEMGKGKTFGTAFYDVYGTSLASFYEDFDNYRKAGYKLP